VIEGAPAELTALERRLAERKQLEPPTALRQRVIKAMCCELSAPQPTKHQPRPWWELAATAAAAALVLSNLSISAAQSTDYRLQSHGETQPVDVTAKQIRQLLPELSQGQALGHAMMWQGGNRLVLAPWLKPRTSALSWPDTQEDRR